ncbi:hypothetical protein HYALB_00005466, partial [Hymenoscyphus albidus]
ELLKRLEAERTAYLTTLQLVQDALAQSVPLPISGNGGAAGAHPLIANLPARTTTTTTDSLHSSMTEISSPTRSSRPSQLKRRSTPSPQEAYDTDLDAPLRTGNTLTGGKSLKSSFVSSGHSDASDDDESLYVQDLLAETSFSDEDLKNHLRAYEWDEWSFAILKSLFTRTGRVKYPNLWNEGKEGRGEEGARYSLYQVFEVGVDGTPLPLHSAAKAVEGKGKDEVFWGLVRDINTNSERLRQAVGRITILREPSSIAFAAIHLTMNHLFDMDHIYKLFVEQGTTAAHMKGAFHSDPRKQKSFVFSFEYYTLIGDDCHPMSWQQSDRARSIPDGHIPISRCSSIVALSLVGEPIKKLKNSARRAKTQFGYVYSPWSPWHVLNIECYPDWKSNTGSHDSTKHYVNGPEAFLNTVLIEYRDAEKRFDEICQKIEKLVTPPADFMFNGELRDKLLFEDAAFTYSRRYFWAFQTLGTMNQSIKAMIDAYTETFTDPVWAGAHSTLWPLSPESSARDTYFKKRLASLKKDFDHEINKLNVLLEENNTRRKEIRDLRDNLFSGTSVLESRKSVEQTEITVQQGQNIKLLTLVNIFFLPLTFVTSVFGMTNMPTDAGFWRFGLTLAVVCVPFFFLIGSMNTNRGMRFWRENVGKFGRWIGGRGDEEVTEDTDSEDEDDDGKNQGVSSGSQTKHPKGIQKTKRSLSAVEGIKQRTGQFVTSPPVVDGSTPTSQRKRTRTISFGNEIETTAANTNTANFVKPALQRRKTVDEIQAEIRKGEAGLGAQKNEKSESSVVMTTEQREREREKGRDMGFWGRFRRKKGARRVSNV